MKEALKLILEAMTYRVQRAHRLIEWFHPIDAFASHTKAKAIAKERMIEAIEKL